MGIGGVIGQDEAREWIGTTKVAGATNGCGAVSPEAGRFNGVSTVSVCMFQVFHGLLFGAPHKTHTARVTGARTKTPPVMKKTKSTIPMSYI